MWRPGPENRARATSGRYTELWRGREGWMEDTARGSHCQEPVAGESCRWDGKSDGSTPHEKAKTSCQKRKASTGNTCTRTAGCVEAVLRTNSEDTMVASQAGRYRAPPAVAAAFSSKLLL
jgi:hypothetical protein